MQPLDLGVVDQETLKNSKTIHFAEGLPAFEQVKEFVLLSREEEAPFLWLQAVSIPNLAFITIDPFLICQGYKPDVPDDEAEALKIQKPEDALLLSIVNLNNNREIGITANLVSPIVVNWKERLGKQVIINNHHLYSVRYRIEAD